MRPEEDFKGSGGKKGLVQTIRSSLARLTNIAFLAKSARERRIEKSQKRRTNPRSLFEKSSVKKG